VGRSKSYSKNIKASYNKRKEDISKKAYSVYFTYTGKGKDKETTGIIDF